MYLAKKISSIQTYFVGDRMEGEISSYSICKDVKILHAIFMLFASFSKAFIHLILVDILLLYFLN